MTIQTLLRLKPVAAHHSAGAFTHAIVATTNAAGDGVELARGSARWPALVSLGCLIRPRPGDAVLVFHDGEEDIVIQVLRREGAAPAVLALPGGGALAVEGDTLALTGTRRLSLSSDRLDLHGRSLALVAESTTWLGKVLTGVVERFRMSARTHEICAERLVEKAGDRTALIGGTDSVRAETRMITVTGLASETAQSKVIAVADDLRMDGKRITMG